MLKCPDERPYYLSVYCVSCEIGYMGYASYYNPTANQCLERCPAELPEVGTSRVCMSCRERYPGQNLTFWDAAAEKCVEACSETNENGACMFCNDFGYDAPYWNAELGRCVSCADAFPGDKEIWNQNERICVKKCPAATPEAE